MEDMVAAAAAAEDTGGDVGPRLRGLVSSLLSAATLKPVALCLVLQLVQQWCGVPVIIFKTVHVFRTLRTSLDHNLCTVIVGAVAFAATFCKCITFPDFYLQHN